MKLKEISVMKSKGHDVINLGIGSPDMAPPDKVIDKLVSAAKQKDTHGYQSYRGVPELRNAFADFYKNHYDVNLNPEDEILPLLGSKEGINYISQTYIEKGDKVLIPNPGYPSYASATLMAGGEVIYYDLEEKHDWLPDLQNIEAEDLTEVKIMWINYPHMPTGKRASLEKLKELVDFAVTHKILLVNDNPYSLILNDEPLSIFTPGGLNQHIMELNSLSKSFNMAGWRVGAIIATKDHIQNLLKTKSNVDSGMFLPVQLAAVEALNIKEEWLENLNNTYRNRRKIVFRIMDALKSTYDPQQAGLFVWGKVSDDIADVEAFTDKILYESGVFVVPGTVFGSNGARYVRISLCNDEKILEEALKRIKNLKI